MGELTKAETRALARRLGLATADKPESVEICFVPDDDYVGVLERHLPADAPALAPGPAGHHDGRGRSDEHEGFARYTIGQRQGPARRLRRAAVRGGHPARAPRGRDRHRRRARRATGSRLEELNWLADPARAEATRARCRSATGRAAVPATVARRDADGGSSLALATPVRAITPGQSGVLYGDDGQVLGGGVIAASRTPSTRSAHALLLLHWLFNAVALWVAA